MVTRNTTPPLLGTSEMFTACSADYLGSGCDLEVCRCPCRCPCRCVGVCVPACMYGMYGGMNQELCKCRAAAKNGVGGQFGQSAHSPSAHGHKSKSHNALYSCFTGNSLQIFPDSEAPVATPTWCGWICRCRRWCSLCLVECSTIQISRLRVPLHSVARALALTQGSGHEHANGGGLVLPVQGLVNLKEQTMAL